MEGAFYRLQKLRETFFPVISAIRIKIQDGFLFGPLPKQVIYLILIKMNICLFRPEEVGKPLDIRDDRAQHIIKILHKNIGDSFSAGIIGQSSGLALITDIHTEKGTSPDGKKIFMQGFLTYSYTASGAGKPLYPLKMIVGFPRPIQLKRLLRDMAGLGVSEIHLTATDLGEKSYLKSDLAQPKAAEQMLLEGSIQAASCHVPKVFMHQSLEDCLKKLDIQTGNRLLALDNVRAKESLYANLNKGSGQAAIAAIGSERGWTDQERTLLTESGFTLLGLGKRVLRTETAATVAASLILGHLGYLE